VGIAILFIVAVRLGDTGLGNGNNAVLPDVAGAWVRVVFGQRCHGMRPAAPAVSGAMVFGLPLRVMIRQRCHGVWPAASCYDWYWGRYPVCECVSLRDCVTAAVSCHTVRRVGHTVAELACSSSATAWRRIVLSSV